MTTTQVTTEFTGALSNDLFRVVSLQQRGSIKAAERFFTEAQRWTKPLLQQNVKKYIATIAQEIDTASHKDLSVETIERYLMYAVLLQNYTLHTK